MHEIIFIMGKSASGKDKIFKSLSADEELKLSTVVMYTTRPMRIGETDGVEYKFISDYEANELEKKNKIIEKRIYKTVYGDWKYFTANDGQIDLNSNKKYIIIGTLEAYMKFVEFFGGEHLYPIYIQVNDDIRLERSIKRARKEENPNYSEVCRRFLADQDDFSDDNITNAGITRRFDNNGELDSCIAEIKEAILNDVFIGL